MKQRITRKSTAALLSAIAVVGMGAVTAISGFADDHAIGKIPSSTEETALLGDVDEDGILAEAANFSLFLEGDFNAKGADCEGRLAVGGELNVMDGIGAYSIGAHAAKESADAAVLYVGEGPVGNCVIPGEASAAIGRDMADEDVHITGTENIYRTDLIDMSEAFSAMQKTSAEVAEYEVNGTASKGQYEAKVTLTGEGDSDIYVWTFTTQEWSDLFSFPQLGLWATPSIDFIVPDDSTVVINITGINIHVKVV